MQLGPGEGEPPGSHDDKNRDDQNRIGKLPLTSGCGEMPPYQTL
jgi:hypothetical protein